MERETPSLDEKLAAISRGMFINRCLLIFLSLGMAIVLFAPRLAESISTKSQSLWDSLSPYFATTLGILVGLLAVIFCAAYVVSKLSPSVQPPPEKAEY